MINVLMVGNHPSNKGGMTSVINQILNNDWEKDGINLSFIPTFIPGNAIKKSAFFVVAYLRILTRFILNKPDVVHMHMSYKGSFTRKCCIHKLCRVFNVPDIIHLHGSEFEKWYSTVDDKQKKKIKKLLSESSYFIVLGEKWENVVKRIEPKTNAIVINNGVRIPNEMVYWNEEKCNCLYFGVLIKRKGLLDLISAISRMKTSEEIQKIHLIIAGNGEEEKDLKTQVNIMGLNDYISFTGWISGDEKEKLIKSCQIMVLPSYNEGLPISLLEAASYGMPIVATDVGDVSLIVRDGVNGMLFEPGDINKMADSILYCSNKEHFLTMSKGSRAIAKELFSQEQFINKVRNLYFQTSKQ